MIESGIQKMASADELGAGNSPIMDDELTPRTNDEEEISSERIEAVYKYTNS